MNENKRLVNEMDIGRFFDNERSKNVNWIKSHYRPLARDAEDLVQEAVVALLENIRSGKDIPSGSFPAYLRNQCKWLAMKKLKRSKGNNNSVMMIDWSVPSSRLDEIIGYGDNLEDKFEKLRAIVKNLPEPCETILWGFYELRLHMSEIAEELGYKNANVAKSKKTQCLSKLEKKLNEI